VPPNPARASASSPPTTARIGAIRQLFPRDRATQDLHFDQIATSHASNNGGGGDTPTPPDPKTDKKDK
jgi:hypothetical protein